MVRFILSFISVGGLMLVLICSIGALMTLNIPAIIFWIFCGPFIGAILMELDPKPI